MITLLDIRNTYDHIVIPCSSVKLSEPAPAMRFYCSNYFARQLRLTRFSGVPYSILSTKYGLVHPDFICHPYDMVWSRRVIHNNKGMLGREIHCATEEHRRTVARQALEALEGKKVFTFCASYHKKYFPDWDFFNTLIKSRGIKHSMAVMHRICDNG